MVSMKLLILPLASGMMGSSGEKRHYPSTMNLYLNYASWTGVDRGAVAVINNELRWWWRTILLVFRGQWFVSIWKKFPIAILDCLRSSKWMFARHLSLWVLPCGWRCYYFRFLWMGGGVPWGVDEIDCSVDSAVVDGSFGALVAHG